MTDAAPAARLRRYAPGFEQAAHEHDAAHLSLVVAGGFEETDTRGVAGVGAGQAGLRPDGMRHGVRFGPQGAVVLTFAPPPPPDARLTVADPAWSRVLPRVHLRRLAPLLLEGGEAGAEAAWDLLALCRPEAKTPRPDPWLRAVRDRLVETPGDVRLTDLARTAGRHRGHLGRAFLAAFGETPSVFRRRAMLDRALCLAAQGLSAAQAAVEAGFARPSHFPRARRGLYGLPPGRLAARPA